MPPQSDLLQEAVSLLRHGSSRVVVSCYGQCVTLDCNELWVEMHTEKRVRLNKLVYGVDGIKALLSRLPDGEYGADAIKEKLADGNCQFSVKSQRPAAGNEQQ